MTYLYENLSPERFQQFCQALLVTQFPNAQCLPVAQPDGGRDAYLWRKRTSDGETELIIFQVKFARSPADRSSTFVEDVSDLEMPKVKRLISRGAKAYYLLTNVPGTAHPDVGSIDRMDVVLSDALGLPAYCWWRDDLDRRVDGAIGIKWSYPEIISALDLLPVLLQTIKDENGERRDSAIKAYLTEQYEIDQEVKFKQVDLYNSLLDLFIDVPIRYAGSRETYHLMPRRFRFEPDISFDREREGAANLLLSGEALHLAPRIVLQGAPGQGKSTITQYLCQTQRMRLLKRENDLIQVKADHRVGEVRLPFRVDLRDYASWVSGTDPFAADPKTTRSAETTSSLESFLARQVSELSGGYSFDVNDFSAVCKSSRVLIVLDGFDEVANVATREQLVREISRSVARLESVALGLQVVVTSRPAAFANSPGFPEKSWHHFSLDSLTVEGINEYAEKWMKARSLSVTDQADFRSVLSQKLDQPHMRDLARNPMQLAILLNLIQTRGLSLPDKRTHLYDSYMELFFNREAEKSSIVRERRDLLLELHRYLAWLLHGEAETEKGRGSIAEERLHSELKAYLQREGHPTFLVDELFTGAVERVGAIVARTVGAYEFEVQPLREYFAAKYLYDTAPHSPPGDEKRGTKPERLDALARNFYWLNVTRFYCGCYSTGELLSIVDELELLSNSTAFKDIGYSRVLALMLLGDWVFTQQPRTVTKVVNFVASQPGFRTVIAGQSNPANSVSLALPDRCGREALLGFLKKRFEESGHRDEEAAIAGILVDLLDGKRVYEFWESLGTRTSTPASWIGQGSSLGVFGYIGTDAAKDLHRQYGSAVVSALAIADRFDILESDSKLFAGAVELALAASGGSMLIPRHWREEVAPFTCRFGLATSPFSYTGSFEAYTTGVPLMIYLKTNRHRHQLRFAPPSSVAETVDEDLAKRVESFVAVFEEQAENPVEVWSSSLTPWSAVVEEGIRLFGEQPLFWEIASLSAGIRSKIERGRMGRDLFDSVVPYCERARYARFRSGSASWWRTQLEAADTVSKQFFALVCLFCWGAPPTIIGVDDVVSKLLSSLDQVAWRHLARTVQRARKPTKGSLSSAHVKEISRCSVLSVALMSLRTHDSDISVLYDASMKDYAGSEARYLTIAAETALRLALENQKGWDKALPLIRRAYKAGNVDVMHPIHYTRGDEPQIPITTARVIARDAINYPLHLIRLADASLTKEAGASAKHVRQVAFEERWFADFATPT